ncbi:hypothetical protein I79_006334 [Cricetulus griseus]|uniref:Uncharacterized protein n=1 Tax=Cricetulus griseus TaxID=10029 RepID=G3H7K2_CRIGR|nr:hypothetical protein I79_006334 [Cricetulus griseus]
MYPRIPCFLFAVVSDIPATVIRTITVTTITSTNIITITINNTIAIPAAIININIISTITNTAPMVPMLPP